SPGFSLLGSEIASQSGRDAEGLKEARRHKGLSELLRDRARGLRLVLGIVAGDRLKGRIHPVPVFNAYRSGMRPWTLFLGIVLPDGHEFVAVREWKRTQQHGIDRGKDRAVCANAQHEREDNCGGKSRSLAHHAPGKSQVDQSGFQNGKLMDFAQLLGGLLFAAELESCPAAGLIGRHATPDVLSREFLNMKVEFAIDLSIHNGFGPEESQLHTNS